MKLLFLGCASALTTNWQGPDQASWQQPDQPWQQQSPFARPSNWQEPAPSVWTPGPEKYVARPAPNPVAPNPALAGRSPSEQLQITKCRSAQNCEKCRQLNCYWDGSARITNRCIALGLEQSQIPIENGLAQNLGKCPARGQSGSVGVNWLAIEASGAQVPNLDGMGDNDIQRWLSSMPNYDPDATEVNYPAGNAFRDLLPTAASQYADGKLPSTTPWVSFWDGLNSHGGYSYDEGYYIDGGYSYDGFGGDWGDSWGSFDGDSWGDHSHSPFSKQIGAPSFAKPFSSSIPSVGGFQSSIGGFQSSIGGFQSSINGGFQSPISGGFSSPFAQPFSSISQPYSSLPSSLPIGGISTVSQPFSPLGQSFGPIGQSLPAIGQPRAMGQPSFGQPLSGLSSVSSFGQPLPSIGQPASLPRVSQSLGLSQPLPQSGSNFFAAPSSPALGQTSVPAYGR